MKLAANLSQRFQRLTSREKAIVTLTAAIGVWGLWDRLVWTPLAQQQELLQQELQQSARQFTAQQATVAKLTKAIVDNPNRTNQQKLTELNAELARVHSQLTATNQQFIPPRLMAKALSDVLQQDQQLTLVKLDTLPATQLGKENKQFFPLYKHGITLTFTGDFWHTLAYLNALETLSWQIHWDSIDYQVKTHPIAETTLQIYTQSFEESWLGV
jgi:MSHA biogenesis protein MshJ